MSNWVMNKVRAVNERDVDRLMSILLKKDNYGNVRTNFNGIIPMPDDLLNTEHSTSEEAQKKMAENSEKYGYSSWYDFSCEKWGTKWDNNEVLDCGGRVICFNTAWSIPYGIYMEISKTIPIIVAYADEAIGYNCGILRFEDGQVLDIRKDVGGTDAQFSNAVWGYHFYYDEDPSTKDDYSEEVSRIVDDIVYG